MNKAKQISDIERKIAAAQRQKLAIESRQDFLKFVKKYSAYPSSFFSMGQKEIFITFFGKFFIKGFIKWIKHRF